MRHLIRLFKSVRKLGIVDGLAVYWAYVFFRLSGRERWVPQKLSVQAPTGPFWMRPGVSDWIVMERIFIDEEYDPVSARHADVIAELERRIVASGQRPLIIDCGANVGISSLWFARRHPHSIVLAVEPEPDNFAVLKRNAALMGNIIPIHAAISDRMSRVDLSNNLGTPWSWRTVESGEGAVPTLTIGHLIGLDDSYVPLIVKIDIEGFETSLFRSNTDWVDGIPLVIFEMHDWMIPWSGSGHAFLAALTRDRRDYLMKGENMFAYSRRLLLGEATEVAREPIAACSQ
jgi:FkbM family methyltransferase